MLLYIALVLIVLFAVGGTFAHLLWWGLIIAVILLVAAMLTRSRGGSGLP